MEVREPLNEMIVGFGQTRCAARKPKCDRCPIAETCPYHGDLAETPTPKSRRRKKVEEDPESETDISDQIKRPIDQKVFMV
jgi:adenine-specific DNA glycosylase